MARVRSKNQCSCCKKSSSSERPPSSSTDPSYDPPSSSKDPSSGDPSSDNDPSSSDPSSTSREMGRCCSIPKRYVVDEEVFESNDFETAQEWIRSQRSGREEIGYLFHGPIRLRFDGGWYVAVICLGEENDDGSCDCDIQPDIYDCSETDDPGYCYYLAGIPGLGVFTPGGDCDCDESGGEGQANTSQGCDKCSDTFRDCELGCGENGCSCCWEPPPAAGPDGVLCTKQFRVLSYDAIQTHWPEILQQGDCNSPDADPNSAWGRLIEYCSTVENIEADSIHIVRMRDSSEPCRVEVWGECSCASQANMQPDTQCVSSPTQPKTYQKAGGQDFGVEHGCECRTGSCKDDCYNKDDLEVDVLDEWQAGQIGGEWKDPAVDGECPEACEPPGYACIYPCYKGIISGCEGLASEQEAIDCVSFVNPDNPGASWPARGYLPVGIECSPGSWSGFIVCCYDCLGFGDLCLVCLSGTGNPEFPQGQDPVREPGWEDDVFCKGYDGESKANKQSCGENPPDNYYKEVLRWTPGDEAPDGCDTDGICDPPFDDETLRKLDEAIDKQLERQKMNKAKGGAGTELTKLLKFFGIEATEKGCKCKSRAAKMDKNGIEWCSNNIEKICDWLSEEAKKRKLPFLRTAGRIIVLRAIRNARAKGFE